VSTSTASCGLLNQRLARVSFLSFLPLSSRSSGCQVVPRRSQVRRSRACVVLQAGQRAHKNQYRAVIAAPIVGENSVGSVRGALFPASLSSIAHLARCSAAPKSLYFAEL
jgi:hypothetical protein